MKTYRIVADYGYGDKSWVERGLKEKEILKWFIEKHNYLKDTTFAEIQHFYRDSDYLYFFEEDNSEDQEDWDWLSS